MRKVKLSWEDQIKMKKKKEEDILNLNQFVQHKSVEVKVNKKSSANDSKIIDDYDYYIIEKALANLKSEMDKKSQKTIIINDETKMELEFHEQYFS